MQATEYVPIPPPVGYRPPWEEDNSEPPASEPPIDLAAQRERKREERARRSRVRKAAPACPIRPGEPCTLCQAFVTGPQDCQTVRLVMEDDELREILAQKRREYIARTKGSRASSATGNAGYGG
ncbi:MAG: hypothetical protein Q4P05_08525 [Actinomycetaceae bacterium]|nr:hypothetical protein [Actinomycetaceae bacterium]